MSKTERPRVPGLSLDLKRTTTLLHLEWRAGGGSVVRPRAKAPHKSFSLLPYSADGLRSTHTHPPGRNPGFRGSCLCWPFSPPTAPRQASAPSAEQREAQKSPVFARSLSPSLQPLYPAGPALPGGPSSPFHLPRLLRPLLPPISTPLSSPP